MFSALFEGGERKNIFRLTRRIFNSLLMYHFIWVLFILFHEATNFLDKSINEQGAH